MLYIKEGQNNLLPAYFKWLYFTQLSQIVFFKCHHWNVIVNGQIKECNSGVEETLYTYFFIKCVPGKILVQILRQNTKY